MRRFLFLFVLLLAAPYAFADTIAVAVAANFTAPMRELAERFRRDTGHELQLSFGATGTFYAQIRNGAPFAVLLAADQETPARLEQEGYALAGSRITYAVGKLALWSPDPALVDEGGEVLRRGNFNRIALANPRHAPYGAAAMAAMQALGVHEPLVAKFVLGENVGQAFQFVASGNAELGFVALAQVYEAPGRLRPGSLWLVPQTLYPPIRQDAVILLPGAKDGRPTEAVARLLTYLQEPAARALIRAYGYE